MTGKQIHQSIALFLVAWGLSACVSNPQAPIEANPVPAPPPIAPHPPFAPPPPVPGAAAGLAAPFAAAPARSMARSASPVPRAAFAGAEERYAKIDDNPVRSTQEARFSTFGVDVDTGAYSNVRRFLNLGQLPPQDAVRVEEMINYFRYDLPGPADRAQPFTVTTDLAVTPWNPDTRLLRIALRGYEEPHAERPPASLVFLVDVSGSMNAPDKLELVKATLALLADQLRPQDRVSVVTYSQTAQVALAPTADRKKLKLAIEALRADGSTAGAEAIQLAYATARASMIPGGVNRIILATDGDFNVGLSDPDQLKDYVARNRDDGITLTTLGFGEGNYSEAMLEGLADAGNGNYAYIDGVSEARKVLVDELGSTLFTIAQDVKVQVEFNPAYVAEYRLIGYENRLLATEDFKNDKVDAGDIGAGHQVTALYELSLVGSKGRLLPDGRYGPQLPDFERLSAVAELAAVDLRYKLPGGSQSVLVKHTVPTLRGKAASAPSGDFAFAAAVAAFGQKLRGGKYIGTFSDDDIIRLAGPQRDFHRQEFLQLVRASKAAR